MKISLLIDPDITKEIFQIMDELYGLGYMANGDITPSPPLHIKLAEATMPDQNKYEQMIEEINDTSERYMSETIRNFKLVNEENADGSSWVALFINEDWLKDLSRDLEIILDYCAVNQTRRYKEDIYKIRMLRNPNDNVDVDDCIADHLNLLTKCKKEFADVAVDKFRFLTNLSGIKPNSLHIEVG